SCKFYVASVVEKYRGEEWFCTEAEAKKAGYVKSKSCK
ncbi:MAG: sunset domain-containing protein, partial [Candidatus Heimdallarchaeaceae archaeon]